MLLEVAFATISPLLTDKTFKFGTEFYHTMGDTLQMFKAKVNGLGQGVKGQGHSVMYQQQKRYNTAMNRFSDFKW